MSETLLPGTAVNEVARRHGLPANHVAWWRMLAENGRLVLPAPEEPVEFAALMVGSTGSYSETSLGCSEKRAPFRCEE